MILTWRVVPGLALCVALLTVSSAFYAGIGEAPVLLFGDDVFVIAPPPGKIPGQTDGVVPHAITGPLAHEAAVEAVSAEIFVPTVVGGASAMARGVDFRSFLAVEGARLARGRAPATPREAVLGEGIADALGLDVGSRVTVPGSTARVIAGFEVSGILASDGPAADEILLPLEAARTLTGVRQEHVHVIRVRTGDPASLKALVEAVEPRFSYSDVRLSATKLLPGEPVTMRANLTNWGRVPAVKEVLVRGDDAILASRAYTVGALSTLPVEVEFSLGAAGAVNVTVNPTFRVEVVRPNLTFLELPRTVHAGAAFAVRVGDPDRVPQGGVAIEAAGVRAVTDGNGTAFLSLPSAGWTRIAAERNLSRGERVLGDVFVVPRSLALNASATVLAIHAPPGAVGSRRPVAIAVEVENSGGVPGSIAAEVTVNGEPAGSGNATLDPGRRGTIRLELEPLAPGRHEIGVVGSPVRAFVEVVPGDDPRIEALLRAYDERARNPRLSSSTGEGAEDYVERTLGNLAGAVLVLSVASGGLAALGAVAVLSRQLAQRERSLGILKALGASNAYVLDLATAEAATRGAAAAVAGLLSGMALAELLDAWSLLHAFGHAVRPAYGWRSAALILLLSVSVVALMARLLVGRALAAPADALIRGRGRDARGATPSPLASAIGEPEGGGDPAPPRPAGGPKPR